MLIKLLYILLFCLPLKSANENVLVVYHLTLHEKKYFQCEYNIMHSSAVHRFILQYGRP